MSERSKQSSKGYLISWSNEASFWLIGTGPLSAFRSDPLASLEICETFFLLVLCGVLVLVANVA